mmetsp:Transcript_16770/g.52585  ORF Transcript_16770/g.52585 Transcript_16770/m.52585 type:complete len:218 (+) Transcript_16770:97-750(+)|eukprot:CAMPEP_0204527742 /NCGR_PEP_ID=MMETSP0661-20131031/9143_1 /ASSEMBLY_ACC=CAM_ASM_000606 /TAXON_ID=109239 /ORGANISM="Alexandrium margalefi, Strain AMGDE01CS-322" /LENGTH=217 /DNA_ID=CAMNT_0051533673 /DNA_START=102 /DNA_END=755 /DNA_ORIENTATION=-
MAPSDLEVDFVLLKGQRAVARRRHLLKKRAEYQRSLLAGSQSTLYSGAGSSSRSEHAGARPHGLLRTATRTCLAKGILETASDLPRLVSVGRAARGAHPQKPSVASVLTYVRSQTASDELPCCSQEYLDWLLHTPGLEAPAEECLRQDHAEAETTATEVSDTEAASSESAEEIPAVDWREGTNSHAEPPHGDEAGWELLPCGTRCADAEAVGWNLLA